jgi:hypothetical protein
VVEYLTVFSHVGFFVALSVDMATGQLFRRQKGLARMDDAIANIEGKASENETRLETQIQARLGARVRHIRVLCRGQGVILQERARTYYIKQLAQHLPMKITNLPILANEIEVC